MTSYITISPSPSPIPPSTIPTLASKIFAQDLSQPLSPKPTTEVASQDMANTDKDAPVSEEDGEEDENGEEDQNEEEDEDVEEDQTNKEDEDGEEDQDDEEEKDGEEDQDDEEEKDGEEDQDEDNERVEDKGDDQSESIVAVEDEALNTGTVNQLTSLFKNTFGSRATNELLELQLQLSNKLVESIQKAKEDSHSQTLLLELKYLQAEARAEQLAFENQILKQEMLVWKRFRSVASENKIYTPQLHGQKLRLDPEAASLEWEEIILIDSCSDKAYYKLEHPYMEVFTSSIKAIPNDMWLDDCVMNTFCCILAQEMCRFHGAGYAITMSSQLTKYIYTTFDDEPNLLPHLAKAGFSANNTQHFFFPLFIDEMNHWVLVWMDFTSKVLTIYNTMKTCKVDYQATYNNTLYLIEKYTNTISKNPFQDEGWRLEPNTKYQQKDNDNCGVHVCILAHKLGIDGGIKGWSGTEKACQEYRKFILGVFHAYCEKVYVG